MVIGFGEAQGGVTERDDWNEARSTQRSARAPGAQDEADAAAPGRRSGEPVLTDRDGAVAASGVVGAEVARGGFNTDTKLAELHGQGVPQGGVPDQGDRLTPNNPKTTPRHFGPSVILQQLDKVDSGVVSMLGNEGGGTGAAR